MSTVEVSIDIAAPVEDVWAAAMDPQRTLEWVTIAREVGESDDGPLRKGFQMAQKLCLRSVPFWVHWELKEVDAPHYARWEGHGPMRSKAVIEDRLEAVNGGTRFRYRNEFKAPLGPLGAAAQKIVAGGVPEREAHDSLARLKALLER
jgi:uncharacterized protein YndB with AHSA1/START domain